MAKVAPAPWGMFLNGFLALAGVRFFTPVVLTGFALDGFDGGFFDLVVFFSFWAAGKSGPPVRVAERVFTMVRAVYSF